MLQESAMIGIYLKSKSASTSNALYVDPPPNPTAAYSNADMKNKKIELHMLKSCIVYGKFTTCNKFSLPQNGYYIRSINAMQAILLLLESDIVATYMNAIFSNLLREFTITVSIRN